MANKSLKAKFDKILDNVKDEPTDEHYQQLITLAKSVGVEISVADIKNYLETPKGNSENLTDDELEMVAGGKSSTTNSSKTDDKLLKLSGRGCFTADSKVSTPHGNIIISEIKVGDEVISVDAVNKKVVGKVTEVRPIVNEEIYKVEFSNGAVWFTTATQWFYCGNDDYSCAIDSQGKSALTEDGKTADVVKVTKTGETKKVYDFIVDGIAAEGYSVE